MKVELFAAIFEVHSWALKCKFLDSLRVFWYVFPKPNNRNDLSKFHFEAGPDISKCNKCTEGNFVVWNTTPCVLTLTELLRMLLQGSEAAPTRTSRQRSPPGVV